jgi:hypothetical protein
MTKEKILDKLQKIKKHQESAEEIGNEAEAQAFAEMLQKLLFTHRLEMSDLDFEKMEAEEPIETHPIRYPEDLKHKRSRVVWRERLTSIVARAHFCRILVRSGSSQCTLVGRKSDVEIAEYMIITLMSTCRKLSKQAESKYRRETGLGSGSGFRDSWLAAFIARLEQRFTELRRDHETSSSVALVRVNKSEAAVNDFMKKFGKATQIGRLEATNSEGWHRGRAAADAINLRANAMGASARVKEIK